MLGSLCTCGVFWVCFEHVLCSDIAFGLEVCVALQLCQEFFSWNIRSLAANPQSEDTFKPQSYFISLGVISATKQAFLA